MIPNLYPTKEINLDGRIEYCSGNALAYERIGGEKGNYRFTYTNSGEPVCFNSLLSRSFRFVPVEHRTRFILQEDRIDKKYPEIQVSIPDIGEDELKVMDVLHEIGHAMDSLALEDLLTRAAKASSIEDIREAPALAKFIRTYSNGNYLSFPDMSGRLTQRLIKTYIFFNNLLTEEGFDRLTENSAWNYALMKRRELGVLPDVSGSRIHEYISYMLLNDKIHRLEPGIFLC